MDDDGIRALVLIADVTIRDHARPYVAQLLQDPKYRIALDDQVITLQDLEFLALFEKTRSFIYRPGERAIEEVITAFGMMTGMDGEKAYDRVAGIESQVSDYNNTLEWYFGDYARSFSSRHRM